MDLGTTYRSLGQNTGSVEYHAHTVGWKDEAPLHKNATELVSDSHFE